MLSAIQCELPEHQEFDQCVLIYLKWALFSKINWAHNVCISDTGFLATPNFIDLGRISFKTNYLSLFIKIWLF